MQELSHMILSSSSVMNHEYEVTIPLELDNSYDDLIDMTLNIIYDVQTNYFTSSIDATFIFQRGDNPTPEGPIMLPNPLLDDDYADKKSKGKFNMLDSFDFSPTGNKKKEKGRIFLLNNAPFSKN